MNKIKQFIAIIIISLSLTGCAVTKHGTINKDKYKYTEQKDVITIVHVEF